MTGSSLKFESLEGAAVGVLLTADAREKAVTARAAAAAWRGGALRRATATPDVPDRPQRPDRPELKAPRDVPRRKITKEPGGRAALLHALAHIELNAIDLAFDIVARFSGPMAMPDAFVADWIGVGDDEARHFLMLDDRLRELGYSYGDFAAHDGLWQASTVTAHSLLARLAVVPMVLEARGLDVTPPMIAKLTKAEDAQSAAILQVIHDDEIGHVAVGKRWFDFLCDRDGLEPVETWHNQVRRYFRGDLKPPFNTDSRDKAGFGEEFYLALAKGPQA